MQPREGGRALGVEIGENPGSDRARPADEYRFPLAPGRREREARRDLEARYPNVTFEGSCLMMKIDPSVRIEPFAKIKQTGNGRVEITGDSHIKARAEIYSFELQEDADRSGGSFSMLRANANPSGVRKNEVRIVNSIIEDSAVVCGGGINIVESTIATAQRVSSSKSGVIDIINSDIGSHVLCDGLGCTITIEDSKTSDVVNAANSLFGNISIGGSIVNGHVTVAGSGSIQLRCSTISRGCVLAANYSDIDIRNRHVTESVSPKTGECRKME